MRLRSALGAASGLIRAIARATGHPVPALRNRLVRSLGRALLFAAVAVLALPLQPAVADITFVSSSAPTPTASSITSITVSKPAGVVEGDVMVAIVTHKRNSTSFTAPTGWVRLDKIASSSLSLGVVAFYKAVAASEPASYTFRYRSKSAVGSVAIVAYRGVNPTAPIAASVTQTNSSSSTSIPTGSVSVTTTNSMAVGVYVLSSGVTSFTSPAGTSERVNVGLAGSSGLRVSTSDVGVVSTGAIGPYTGTASSSAKSLTMLFALKAFVAPVAGTYRITNSTSGVYCLDSNVSVARPSSGYTGTMRISTSTGRGTWLLASGLGTLVDATPDDGIATYQWNSGDASVALLLRYRSGPGSVGIGAADTSITTIVDDDSNPGILFSPSGFTVTSSPFTPNGTSTVPPFASAITAGSSVPVYLTAYGQLATDSTCGVISDYAGSRSLTFWLDYVNPSSGTVAATVDGTPIAADEASADVRDVVFTGGKAVVKLKYKDSGIVRLNVEDSGSQGDLLPSGTFGSTGAVVSRPADLVVTAVVTPSGGANPASTTATGTSFVASGAAFSVTVQPLDAEGSITPNYGLESPAEGMRLSASLVLPAGGRNGTANDGAIGNATAFTRASSGAFSGSTFFWDEVGVVRLRAAVADGDYLGSGALTGSLSGNVGRFRPSSLAVIGTPVVTPPCTGFAYMDQGAVRVAFTLEARNAQGTRTQNFDTVLLGLTGTGAPSLVAENANSGVDLSGRVQNFSAIWTAGRAAVDDIDVKFTRLAAPDGPYATLALGVRQQGDPDALLVSGADMNATTATACAGTSPASCNAKSLGTLAIHYGRAVLRPGIAAETAPLDMAVTTQRWNGTGFVTNASDSCTAVAASSATLGNFTGNLAVGETAAIAPSSPLLLASGTTITGRHLRLSAPGAGNDGSVRVTLDVSDWLNYDWLNNGTQRDPSATATFGHYRGHDRIVFRREVR